MKILQDYNFLELKDEFEARGFKRFRAEQVFCGAQIMLSLKK